MPDDVMELLQGKRSLREMVDGLPPNRPTGTDPEPPAAHGEAADDWILLPARGSVYAARSRPANKPVATLHLLLADSSSRGFSYVNLDTVDLVPPEEPGRGPVLMLRFAGVVPKEVRITGRNLESIRDYIGHHRIAYLRQLPPGRDFLGDSEEVITGVEIKGVEG